MAARRVSQGGAVEQVVLAVAKTDYDDDRNGASFMAAEQRRMARQLAKRGLLRVLSDTRPEVVAVLTAKGDRLITQRKAAAAEQGKRLPTRTEIQNAERNMHTAKVRYADASDWFQKAKREGPQEEINRAYKNLGEAAASYENHEQHVNALRAKAEGGKPRPTLLQQLMKQARGERVPSLERAARLKPKKKATASKPRGKLFRVRLVPHARGNLVDVKVNGRKRGAGDVAPAGGPELRVMRGVVRELAAANPRARFDLPGNMKSADELVTGARLTELYSWGKRRPRRLERG